MPPKKSAAAKAKTRSVPSRGKASDGTKKIKHDAEEENNNAVEEPEPDGVDAEDIDEEEKAEDDAADEATDGAKPKAGTNGESKKRKTPPTSSSKGGSKAAKQEKSKGSEPSKKQLLNFLLSKDALPFCFPEDELEFARSNPKAHTYSLTSPSEFTPFEHLLCAALLSKPLSHVLGMRSIRTLLNPPYNFRTPESVAEVGEKKVWEALEEARTQHRQKTASYVYGMAEEFVDDNKGGKGKREMMFELSERANEEGAGGVVSWVKEFVKGMGETGGEVFCRRVQCVDGWGDAVWPYVDGKAMGALMEIGLEVRDAEGLQSLVEGAVDWRMVGDMGLNEKDVAKGELVGEEMEMQVQCEFVVCVERALGCVLQGKVKELRSEAAKL
jgi:hypothetical protein